MKQPTRGLLAVVTALAVLVAPWAIEPARAGDIEVARSHYQRGKELYRAGDYPAAIEAFSAADREVSSPVNEYNIALCYDRLGDSEEALRRYRSYLEAMPNAGNRGEVEAAIARLEAALRAEKPRPEKVEPPQKVQPAPPATEPAPPTEVEEPPLPATDEPPPEVTAPPAIEPSPGAEAEVRAQVEQAPPRTGDPELDRVAAIDVAAIRDARRGAAPPPADEAVAAVPPPAAEPPPAQAGAPAGAPVPAPPPVDDEEEDDDPVYKKWWFWVVVGVSAVILIDIAASDSDDGSQPRGLDFGAAGMTAGPASAGPVLLRF